MRKLSIFLIFALILVMISSCARENRNDAADNAGLTDILDPTIGDSEIEGNEGLKWEDDSTTDESTSTTENEITADDDVTQGTTASEYQTDAPSDSSTEEPKVDDTNEEVQNETSNGTETYESESHPQNIESSEESEAAGESDVAQEPETEAYDGMEIDLPDSKRLINEAYSAGMMMSGYSVAKGSGRIVQPYKDNPNLIQIIFETDNQNIFVAINYHRSNANASWKLVTGAPFSIIDLSEENE